MNPRLDIRYNSAHDKSKGESLEDTNFMNIVGEMDYACLPYFELSSSSARCTSLYSYYPQSYLLQVKDLNMHE